MSHLIAACGKKPLSLRRLCGLLLLVWLASGCSTTPIVAPSEFPSPLLRKVPMTVGLYLSPELTEHVHTDTPPRGPKQEVHVGGASTSLFREFLTAQFQQLVLLDSPPGQGPARPGLDAVLAPVIKDVQIAAPQTDKDAFHEAWIQYQLQLLTADGQRITSWTLAAYGKHRGPAIGGGHASLTSAVSEAMRDAAAGMALLFRNGSALQQRVAAGASRSSASELP